MQTFMRAVDQGIVIGHEIVVSPTDIDAKSVRILARGRMLGGPDDGGTFQTVHELARGQSFAIGPCIVVAVIDIAGPQVRLGVHAPPHLGVHRKEAAQNARGPQE